MQHPGIIKKVYCCWQEGDKNMLMLSKDYRRVINSDCFKKIQNYLKVLEHSKAKTLQNY